VSRFRQREPPDPSTLEIRRVLLATEGRPIPSSAIEFAASVARPASAPVHVFSIARVHGTALGFPNPFLVPSRHELEEQRELVAKAVEALKKHGLSAAGRVVGTRKAAKRIVGEADRLGCDVIVMAADPPRNRVVADMMWSQEPYRVRRRARVPVYLVPAS
jgi:nucleotide-binding universal stress UspA family protein